MVLSRVYLALLCSLFLCSSSIAQDDLPKVLIIGDSIYRQPASELNKAYKGKVKIVFPSIQPGEVRNSFTVLEKLDELLGDGQWDLIHLNIGLGDLIYRVPNVKLFRVMPPEAGGVRNTSPAAYEKNLDELIKRIKSKSKAKIIWASTTPIRHSSTHVFDMKSEIDYNQIAAKVMKKHQVQVNDMYEHVKGLINMDKPASHGVDPFFFDRKPIHEPIAAIIQKELKVN